MDGLKLNGPKYDLTHVTGAHLNLDGADVFDIDITGSDLSGSARGSEFPWFVGHGRYQLIVGSMTVQSEKITSDQWRNTFPDGALAGGLRREPLPEALRQMRTWGFEGVPVSQLQELAQDHSSEVTLDANLDYLLDLEESRSVEGVRLTNPSVIDTDDMASISFDVQLTYSASLAHADHLEEIWRGLHRSEVTEELTCSRCDHTVQKAVEQGEHWTVWQKREIVCPECYSYRSSSLRTEQH